MQRSHGPAARRLVSLAIAVAAALIPAAGCSHNAEPETAAATAISVTTAVARTGTMVDRVTAAGTVVVSRAAELTVYAPESAEIAEMPKQEGDRVEVGDLLVRFDITSVTLALSTSEMAVSHATTRLETAKAELSKISALSDKGMVARSALDTARAELVDAQSALTIATGELNSARARQAEGAVRAKFAGVVARRWHGPGDVVIPANTDPVIRIVDETRLQVVAPMAKTDLVRLEPGKPATIAAPGAPGAPGTVASLPAILEAGAPTAEVRFSFAGPTALKRDDVVDVEVLLDQRPNVLIVPRKAVQREDDIAYVMVAGDDNVAHRKTVQVGFTTRGEMQILSGLSAGERVITSGLDQITDGTAILIER